jgi:hypothetical protein
MAAGGMADKSRFGATGFAEYVPEGLPALAPALSLATPRIVLSNHLPWRCSPARFA